MASVQVQSVGGDITKYDAETIAELKSQIGGLSKHQATVNGEPQDDDYELSDYEFVTFSEKIKGA